LQYISRGDGRSILGGSQEVVKATAIAWLKMKNVCILCNVIEIFLTKKND
jgi:hypothetical protein